jgi:hypothetical protein
MILTGVIIGSVSVPAAQRRAGVRPAAVSAPAPPAAMPGLAGRSATATGRLVVLYAFDGGRSDPIVDDSGNGHTLRLVTGNGGTVSAVHHGSGGAVRFPSRCIGARRCPHAALQSPSTASLNPGRRSISYGAMVLLAPSQTTKGQNVLQKGYSATSSQYKLQVDGTAGRASCVLVGSRPGIKRVTSDISVADGSWHTIECRRRPTSLSVLVDGVLRGVRLISPRLSISNGRPLSIGGKGAYSDNDQFQGILDNVWVRIG